MSQAPGHYCLTPVPCSIPKGGKCEHDKGQWLVKWEDIYYSIQPATQLQAEIWLSSAKKEIGDKAVTLLHWLCHDCNNIQMP